MDILHLRTEIENAGLRLRHLRMCLSPFTTKRCSVCPAATAQMRTWQPRSATSARLAWKSSGTTGCHEVWRTSRTTLGRGGAAVTSFDMEQVKDAPLTHGRVYTEAEIWEITSIT